MWGIKQVLVVVGCVVGMANGLSLRDSVLMETAKSSHSNGHGNGASHGNSGSHGNGVGNGNSGQHGNGHAYGHYFHKDWNHVGWGHFGEKSNGHKWTFQESEAELKGPVESCTSVCDADAPPGDACVCDCLEKSDLQYLGEYYECT